MTNCRYDLIPKLDIKQTNFKGNRSNFKLSQFPILLRTNPKSFITSMDITDTVHIPTGLTDTNSQLYCDAEMNSILIIPPSSTEPDPNVDQECIVSKHYPVPVNPPKILSSCLVKNKVHLGPMASDMMALWDKNSSLRHGITIEKSHNFVMKSNIIPQIVQSQHTIQVQSQSTSFLQGIEESRSRMADSQPVSGKFADRYHQVKKKRKSGF
jgi:hypothetical protein